MKIHILCSMFSTFAVLILAANSCAAQPTPSNSKTPESQPIQEVTPSIPTSSQAPTIIPPATTPSTTNYSIKY